MALSTFVAAKPSCVVARTATDLRVFTIPGSDEGLRGEIRDRDFGGTSRVLSDPSLEPLQTQWKQIQQKGSRSDILDTEGRIWRMAQPGGGVRQVNVLAGDLLLSRRWLPEEAVSPARR